MAKKTERELMKEVSEAGAIIAECFYSDKDERNRAKKALNTMKKALKELDENYPLEKRTK
jgi:hypothetical protein